MSIKEKLLQRIDVMSEKEMEKFFIYIDTCDNTDVDNIDVNDPDFLWDTSDKNDPDYYVKCSLNSIKRGEKCYTFEEFCELGRKHLIEEGLKQGYSLEEMEKTLREVEELDDDYEV